MFVFGFRSRGVREGKEKGGEFWQFPPIGLDRRLLLLPPFERRGPSPGTEENPSATPLPHLPLQTYSTAFWTPRMRFELNGDYAEKISALCFLHDPSDCSKTIFHLYSC